MDPRELDIEKRWLLNARTDPEAFGFFYAKYYDRLFRLCYHRVFDHELAEDLVAETFLQAQQNLHRFRWLGLTMGAWLHRIALNQVRYRQRGRMLTSPLRADDERFADAATDPLAALLLDEAHLRVRRAIARLDESTREVFQLHYWDNLSAREIAVILGEREGTVSARLTRGRERVRRLLATADAAETLPEGRPTPDESA